MAEEWISYREKYPFIVLYKYEDEQYDCLFLPGDVVFKQYYTKDWVYCTRQRDQTAGMLPAAFLCRVGDKDDIACNVENVLRSTLQQLKTFYFTNLHLKKEEDEFKKVWGKICSLYACLRRYRERFAEHDLELLTKRIMCTILELPAVGRDKLLVGERCQPISVEDFQFSEVCRLCRTCATQFGETSQEDTGNFFAVAFRGSDVWMKFDEGRIDCHLALFHPEDGFISEFYVYSEMNDMSDPDKVKDFGKKRIVFSDKTLDQTHLVVLVVLNDPSLQSKKCVAFGYKMIDSQFVNDRAEVPIYPYREQPTSLRDQIRRHIETTEKKVNSKFVFSIKSINQSKIKPDDYIFQQNLPQLSTDEVNLLYITLSRAKLTENFPMFGDNLDVGIETYVSNKEGTFENNLDLSGNCTGIYQTLSSHPGVVEWKEMLVIKLTEYWMDLHVLFKIYKYDEKKGKKLVGFSFLPLLQSDTILCDGKRKLMLYQTINSYDPDPKDYIGKQLPYLLELDVKKKVMQKYGRKNRFSVKKEDYLEVLTSLRSTMLKEPNLFHLLDVKPSLSEAENITTILLNFITFSSESAKKKIPFLKQILDALWLILDSLPGESESIFYCFFETVHLIHLTEAYIQEREFLHTYLVYEFGNKNVFSSFITAFIKLLSGNNMALPQCSDVFLPIFKSFGIFLEFLEKSYQANLMEDLEVDASIFEDMLSSIETYLDNEHNESRKGFLFKEMYKQSALRVCITLLPRPRLSNFINKFLRLSSIPLNLRLVASSSVLDSQIGSMPEHWDDLYKVIISQLTLGFAQRDLNSTQVERLLDVLTKLTEKAIQNGERYREDLINNFLNNIIRKYDDKYRENIIWKFLDKNLKKYDERLREEIPSDTNSVEVRLYDMTKLLFISLLDGIEEITVGKLMSSNSMVLRLLYNIRDPILEQSNYKKLNILRMRMLIIIVNFIKQCCCYIKLGSEATEIQHEFVSTILRLLQEEDLGMETRQYRDKEMRTVGDNIRDTLLSILQNFIRKLCEKGKKKLAFHNKNGILINSIFETSLVKDEKIRTTMIGILFEFLKADFLSSEQQSVFECYFWFLKRLLKMYTNRTLTVDNVQIDKEYKDTLVHLIKQELNTLKVEERLSMDNLRVEGSLSMNNLMLERNPSMDNLRVERKLSMDNLRVERSPSIDNSKIEGRLSVDNNRVKIRLSADNSNVQSRLSRDSSKVEDRLSRDSSNVESRMSRDSSKVESRMSRDSSKVESRMSRDSSKVEQRLSRYNLKEFLRKLTTLVEHVDKILDAVIDSTIVQKLYRDFMWMETKPYYFAYITAEYTLYQRLRESEESAVEAGIFERSSELPAWFAEYKHILKDLYDIYIEEGEIICASYTIQELETLIPWRSDKMDKFRELKTVIGDWWKAELDKDPRLVELIGRANKEFAAAAQLDPTELMKIDLTWSECKEILQKLVIAKFEHAAGFECSQVLMDNLIYRYRNIDINFKKLSLVLHNLADIFDTQANFKQAMLSSTTSSDQRLMKENARRDILEPEYFRIEFINAPDPFRFLHGQKFIYRERAMKKADDMSAKLKSWFPDCEVSLSKQALRKSSVATSSTSSTSSSSTAASRMVIFVQKVNPVMTNMSVYENLDIQLQVMRYRTRNETNAFAFKEQINKAGNVRVSLSLTEAELPWMLRWSRVISDQLELEVRPIVSYLTNIQYKNLELQGYLESLQEDRAAVSMTEISMSIQGVILAAVNGGITELQNKFINKEYEEMFPEDKIYVDMLINEIKKQNIYLEGLLHIHGEENKAMESLQFEMQKEFSKRKPMVNKLSKEKVNKAFLVPILDTMTIEKAKETLNADVLTYLNPNIN